MTLKTLNLKASRVLEAIHTAQDTCSDWQAQLCEIALIPEVAERYAELNRHRLSRVHLVRVEGEPYLNRTPEMNHTTGARREWDRFAGYLLRYRRTLPGEPINFAGWNAVCKDSYGHSASVCWDGMRRETDSEFLMALRAATYNAAEGNLVHPSYMGEMARAGIAFINDLSKVEA